MRPVAYEASATRELLQRLFADLGESVVALNKEQVVTRMALLQELYQIRSTFLRNHHEAMLAQQQQLGLLNRILQASLMTERQKESHHLWKHAEAKRRRARTDEDYHAVLALLGESQHLDSLNPAPFMSAGSVHGSLGHDGLTTVVSTYTLGFI